MNKGTRKNKSKAMSSKDMKKVKGKGIGADSGQIDLKGPPKPHL